MKVALFIIVLIFTVNLGIDTSLKVISQNPPCFPEFNNQTYKVSVLKQIPPIDSSMPDDILDAYKTFDSLILNVHNIIFTRFLDNQSFMSDSLKFIRRAFYKLVDYDPLNYFLWTWNSVPYGTYLNKLEEIIIHKSIEFSEQPQFDEILLKTHHILHVKVIKNYERYDSSALIAKSAIISECEILDVIKGKFKLDCNNYDVLTFKKTTTFSKNKCVQFGYAIEQFRGKNIIGVFTNLDDTTMKAPNIKMENDDGTPWIRENSEYIIFLEYHPICEEGGFKYISLSNLFLPSHTGFMYPIKNGKVIYPKDEFKSFGNGLTTKEFKTILKNRIDEIAN